MANRRPRSKPRAASKASPVPSVDGAMRRAFRLRLVDWYAENKRDLPWRRTHDPYAITVSEMMLQQTQVATVLPYYESWRQQFPDWATLALAKEEHVIKAWEGLGYYRRARMLHKLAKAVQALPDGELPGDIGELEGLPGFGPYTARAVGSIAFGLRAAVVDGNVMRVLSRVFDSREDIARPATVRMMQQLADALAPSRDCGDYNQAVMELGALVCTPRSPRCLVCPLRECCRARDPESLPVKTRGKTETREEAVALLERVVKARREWWLERPPEGERMDAMWRFPHVDTALMERVEEPLATLTYAITKYRIRLKAHRAGWIKRAPRRNARQGWFNADEIEALPLASAHRKVWRKLVDAEAKTT